MTTTVTGRATGGKPINLHQLQDELATAGVVASALGLTDEQVYTYDAEGLPADFPSTQQDTVDAAVAAHIALREVTDAEYSAEFQDAGTSAGRKQDIRDITAGLLPRETVPVV